MMPEGSDLENDDEEMELNLDDKPGALLDLNARQR